jgi:pyruvate/2-oxoglutarate/acetoin dehydrogenase E1 component
MPEITYLQAINQALAEEMRRDPNVVLLGEDIGLHGGAFGVTRGLLQEFGDERVRDTPVSENSYVGMAVGAALTGLRPVAEIMFADFSALAFDQIVNEAAKVRYMFGGQASVPMVVRMPQGGLSWKSAGANHSQSVEAWYAHIPGLKVVMPSMPNDAKGLLKASIRDNSPVIFLEHKALYGFKGNVPESDYVIPLGKADIKRTGSDCSVVASGMMVHFALQAADLLSREGIEVEVIDPRTVQPLDEEALVGSVRKTHRAVLVQEAVRTCGAVEDWAVRILESCFGWLDAPIRVLGGADVPVPYADALETYIWPRPGRIAEVVREVCYV